MSIISVAAISRWGQDMKRQVIEYVQIVVVVAVAMGIGMMAGPFVDLLTPVAAQTVPAKVKPGCVPFDTVGTIDISICVDADGHVFAANSVGMITNLGQ